MVNTLSRRAIAMLEQNATTSNKGKVVRSIVSVVVAIGLFTAASLYAINIILYDKSQTTVEIYFADALNRSILLGEDEISYSLKHGSRYCAREELSVSNMSDLYGLCVIVAPASSRQSCKYWWTLQKCVAVAIPEGLFTIELVRERLDTAMLSPCLHSKILRTWEEFDCKRESSYNYVLLVVSSTGKTIKTVQY